MSKKYNVSRLFDAAKQAIVGVKGVGSQRAELMAANTAAKARLRFLQTAPRPIAEQIQNFHAAIDALAEQGVAGFHSVFENVVADPTVDGANNPHSFQFLGLVGNTIQTGKVGPDILYYILRDELKRAVAKLFETAPKLDAEYGPPLLERLAEIDQLNGEIAEIERTLQQIDQDAARAGISFSESWK